MMIDELGLLLILEYGSFHLNTVLGMLADTVDLHWRNWIFQVSKDGLSWLTLYTHSDDTALNEPGSTHTWPLDPPGDEKTEVFGDSFARELAWRLQEENNTRRHSVNYSPVDNLKRDEGIITARVGWRHIRIQQMGKNSFGQTHYLSLSGLEIYGHVTGVCEDLGKAAKEAEASLRRQRLIVKTQILMLGDSMSELLRYTVKTEFQQADCHVQTLLKMEDDQAFKRICLAINEILEHQSLIVICEPLFGLPIEAYCQVHARTQLKMEN